jgi:putative oxidoreductase
MKITSTIARYFLGVIFLIFGLNGFLNFLKMPPPSSQAAMQFFTVMSGSHYMALVFLVQLVSAAILLTGFYVPLALTCLAPVLMNILIYHALMDPSGIGPGVFCTILWFLVFAGYRSSFAPLFKAKAEGSTR